MLIQFLLQCMKYQTVFKQLLFANSISDQRKFRLLNNPFALGEPTVLYLQLAGQYL